MIFIYNGNFFFMVIVYFEENLFFLKINYCFVYVFVRVYNYVNFRIKVFFVFIIYFF